VFRLPRGRPRPRLRPRPSCNVTSNLEATLCVLLVESGVSESMAIAVACVIASSCKVGLFFAPLGRPRVRFFWGSSTRSRGSIGGSDSGVVPVRYQNGWNCVILRAFFAWTLLKLELDRRIDRVRRVRERTVRLIVVVARGRRHSRSYIQDTIKLVSWTVWCAILFNRHKAVLVS
jgi:hypothetical protein